MDAHAFPHKVLTPIVGQPTPLALQRLRTELIANAMSVPSNRGGGENGHLCLVLPEEELATISDTPFEIPVNPGPLPVPGANATNAHIAATNAAYNTLVTEAKEYIHARNALRAMILEAVEPAYYDILRDTNFGYGKVTPLQFLEHFKATYGAVTTKDLRKNLKALGAAWNPDDPIDTLWTRVRECQDFAANTTEAISNNMAMLILLDTLEASGVMAPYINEWKRRDPMDQTYDAFKKHFTRANKVRVEDLTAKTAGFHTANATTTVTDTAFATRVANTPPPATPTSTAPDIVVEATNMFYCWTHGLGKHANHTSKTCQRPAPGHQKEATARKTLGGSKEFHLEYVRPPPHRDATNPRNDA